MTNSGSLTCRQYRDSVLAGSPNDDSNVPLGAIWIDDALGAIMKTLEELDELDNTVIVFQPDHGLEGKGSLYETGTRIAQFIHYPDKIAPGATFDGKSKRIIVCFLPKQLKVYSC